MRKFRFNRHLTEAETSAFEMTVQLIRAQQPGDVVVIRRYLTMMREGETALSMLFDFIQERPLLALSDLEKLVEGNFGTKYNNRVYELREAMIHAMNTHYYTQRPGRYSERTQTSAVIRQKLAAVERIWLMSDSMATWLIHRVIIQADKYELYPLLLQALMLARQNLSLRLLPAEYERATAEIARTLEANELATLSIRRHNEAGHRARRQAAENNTTWHDDVLKELRAANERHESDMVSFYTLMIEADRNQRLHRFNDASHALSEALKLLECSPAVDQPHLRQQVRLHQVDVLLSAGEFDQALVLVRAQLRDMKAENFNWLVARKLEADALFYTGKPAESAAIYRSVLAHPNGNFDATYSDTLHFALASALAASGQYNEAIAELQEVTVLPRQNKAGFNLAVRALHCLCLVALGNHGALSEEMQKNKAYYSRLTAGAQIQHRDVALFRILQGYAEASGINHARVQSSKEEHFKLLRSGSDGHRWLPNAFEMIVYDQFLDALAAERAYHFERPRYLIASA